MTSKFHQSLNAAFNKMAEKRESTPKGHNQRAWVVTKAQKQMLMDIDNEAVLPIMYTDWKMLVLDFQCLKDNHKINREVLLALWRKGLIRYNYTRHVFDLTLLGLKFIKLNNEKKTPGIINVKPENNQPYKSKQSLRHEKYTRKAKN
jgi:hypothetical protein